jgi:hypothetical protein
MIQRRTRVPAFIAATLIGGCTAATNSSSVSVPSWKQQCYRSFEQDVSFLASPSAADCGFLSLDATDAQRTRTLACAKQAAAGKTAFKFGYGSYGDDSQFCAVAIRTSDGQLLSVFYDYDVTGQAGTDGSNAALWISRCNEIAFKPGTIGPGSFFRLDGCQEAKDLKETVVNSRAKTGG